MIKSSYLSIFRDNCQQMDPVRDTFARMISMTEDQFSIRVPRITVQDREELHKVYVEELAAARIRASEAKKAAPD